MLKIISFIVDNKYFYYAAAVFIKIKYFFYISQKKRFTEIYSYSENSCTAGLYIKCCINRLFYILDYFILSGLNIRKLDKKIDIVNKHILDKVLTENKKIIFVQIHSGSMILLNAWLKFNWKKTGLFYTSKTGLRKYITDKLVSAFISEGTSSFLKLIKDIKKNIPYLFLIDGVKGENTEKVRFGNAEFDFPVGLLRLIKKEDCIILPVYSKREKWDRVIFEIFEPIESDDINSMQDIFDLYKDLLLKDPSQWFGILERINI